MHLSLYQPDIPQNVGAAIRLCACLGLELDIIEPTGFPWDERKIRQSALDYINALTLNRYSSWEKFKDVHTGQRIILLSTKAALPYTEFSFRNDDILLAGRESAGVPDDVHNASDARVFIPMRPGLRSLNVITACAMVAGEALRQIRL
ncbi:MAG: tRNA (cytidine(34)-2'-O)-methyltransferase [Alphaproteobacteria bacterium]|nr:tRNA (cytidine(34)-2'-O)-methyltransferase [Alphaproteobacteria bacterium]